jgi:hypothetical protein
MQYRQIGTVVTAVQFTGDNEDECAHVAGGLDRFHLLDDDDHRGYGDTLREAEVWDSIGKCWRGVSRGDWIVTWAPRCTLPPIPGHTFGNTYHPAEEMSA